MPIPTVSPCRFSHYPPMHEAAVKRDFALLSPLETLRFAIVIEERNTQLYHRLSERTLAYRLLPLESVSSDYEY